MALPTSTAKFSVIQGLASNLHLPRSLQGAVLAVRASRCEEGGGRSRRPHESPRAASTITRGRSLNVDDGDDRRCAVSAWGRNRIADTSRTEFAPRSLARNKCRLFATDSRRSVRAAPVRYSGSTAEGPVARRLLRAPGALGVRSWNPARIAASARTMGTAMSKSFMRRPRQARGTTFRPAGQRARKEDMGDVFQQVFGSRAIGLCEWMC